MPTPQEVLRQTFGLAEFRPGQREVIDHLLAGRSAAAVFPTGGGKSLCYQLPALLLPGLTLVVSPLLALMREQVERLTARGVAADRIDSTRTLDESRALVSRLRAGELRLLYVAPERLQNDYFRGVLLGQKIALMAIDEAHCISEWGHNFRPDYLKLAGFARDCKAQRVLALTATATPQVLADVCRGFAIDPTCAVRTGFHRPNLTVLTTPVEAGQRDALLVERLTARQSAERSGGWKGGPTIVYVTLQRTAEAVAELLARHGLPARAYHAGMEDADRVAVQEWFAAAKDAVVVATIAFGMGIDKADIRGLYHYNLPKSLENFAQEIGRAGRDGRPSTCEMFVCVEDLNALENFVYADTPTAESIQGLLDHLFGLDEQFSVSLTDLSHDHDLKPLVLGTLLTYLELDGYLEGGTPYWGGYQFVPLKSSREILSRFEGDRRTFLAAVFGRAQKARKWFHLDVEDAAQAAGATRERVTRALEYLAEQGLLELKVSGLRHRYRRLRTPALVSTLAAALHRRTAEREQREIARLEQVLQLVENIGCQVGRLGEHFGDPLKQPCGACTWCLSHRPLRVPPRPDFPIPTEVLTQALALSREHPAELGHPRSLTRFLCGISSPRVTRARLRRSELFGRLENVPFAQVLRQLTALGSQGSGRQRPSGR